MSRRAPAPTFRFPTRRRPIPIERRAAQRAVLAALRAGFGSLASLAPDLSAFCAEVLFRLPPRHARLVRERRAIEKGELRFLPHGGGRLATWTLGDGPPVLAMHGWGGHAGRLSPFFPALLDAGFSVVTLDAPGHGRSSGSLSCLPDFVAAVEIVSRERGPLAGALGHSAGAAAIALAIRARAPIPRAVLLSPPANPEYYAARFAHYWGIPPRIRDAMKRRLEDRYGVALSDLGLTKPHADPSAELLIVHDRHDQRVPWREGAAIAAAWSGARLVSTRGLGHHRILRDPTVIATAVKFLARARAADVTPCATAVAAR